MAVIITIHKMRRILHSLRDWGHGDIGTGDIGTGDVGTGARDLLGELRPKVPQSTVPTPPVSMSPRALLRSVANVAAAGAGASAEVARAAGFGAEAAGHALGNVARSGVLRTVVLRSAFHRFDIFITAAARAERAAVVLRAVDRTDIAEYPGLSAIVLRHVVPPP